MQLTSLSLALTRAGFLTATFTPASLFANGEVGAWYDPSSMDTLFTDSAGTTPVTAVEQPVGLMLDKSKGLVMGPELVTNGTFTTNLSGWTVGASYSWVAGRMYRAPGAADATSQNLTTVAGRFYRVTFTYEVLASLLRINWAGSVVSQVSGTGTASFLVAANGSTTTLSISANATTSSYYIDNISVRELPGNHATQSTSASRPVLSARVNLLTGTESFTGWQFYGAAGGTPTPNSIVAPDGTTTALRIHHNAGDNRFGSPAVQAVVASFAGRVWLKSPTPGDYELWLIQSGAEFTRQVVTLSTNWKEFSVQRNSASTLGMTLQVAPLGTGGISSTRPAAEIHLWHPDLRVDNDGVGLPAYQRVNTSTDYDTAGFPMYLRFDGVDDGMVTNSINFTSTDKMTVWAGVRKLSDAAIGMVAELSTNGFASNGAFYMSAPNGTNNSFCAWISRGSVGVIAQAATPPAPFNCVFTGQSAISSDFAEIRLNGSMLANSASDQGTGNYGNYPLYIGRRGGAILPFNGRLHSLIVRGAQSTAEQIAATETYVNSRTKAY
jgi:hypothetical protein